MFSEPDDYRIMLEKMPQAFACHRIITDEDNNPVDYVFLDVNRAFEEMTGLVKEEILGRRITEVLPGITAGEFDWIKTYGRVALNGESMNFKQYSDALGRWYEITAYSSKPGYFVTVFHDVTEAQKAEKEHQVNKNLIFNLFDSIQDGIIIVSPGLTIQRVNDTIKKWYGHDVIYEGKKCHKVFLNRDKPCDPCPVLRCFLTGGVEREESKRKTVEGDKWTEIFSYPVFGNGSEAITGVIEVVRDITGRKEMENTLRDREESLATTLYSIGDGVITTDAAGRITRMNAHAERLTGWPFREAGGRVLSEVFSITSTSADNGEPAANPAWQVLETGERVEMANDTILSSRDGSKYQIADSAAPIRDSSGNITGVVMVFSDVTEQYLNRKALRESEERFQKMLSLVPDMVSIHDPDMNIIYSNWNGFAAVSLEKRILNTKCYYTYRGFDEVCSDCLLRDVLESKETICKEKKLPEGMWVEVRAIPILDNEGEVELVVEWVRDITDLRDAQVELQQLNKDLEERVKNRTAELETLNKELDAFSYSVSHDLRAPLRNIDGFSQALLEDYDEVLDEQGHLYLHRICRAAGRMGELIEDLLKLSRITRHKLRRDKVNLSKMINSLIVSLREREPEHLVEVSVMPDVIVTGDASMLLIAMENLLDNAWKFTRNVPGARIEFQVINKDAGRVFKLQDNGVGFNMDYVHKMFMAFQRLHQADKYAGTGIGLNIVSRIINRHGGEIWAEGKPGKGAAFFFTVGNKTGNMVE